MTRALTLTTLLCALAVVTVTACDRRPSPNPPAPQASKAEKEAAALAKAAAEFKCPGPSARFMVDDGTTHSGLGRPSDGNQLLDVTATGNGTAGIVVEGGTANVVAGARVSGGSVGIWVRNEADQTRVTANRVTGATDVGIRLGPGLGETEVSANVVVGGRVGIRSDGSSATWIAGGRISGATHAGLQLDGDQGRARFSHLSVLTAGAPQVRRNGVPSTVHALLAPPDPQAGPRKAPGISLVSVLHRMVFVLWALILVPASLTRLGARRRWS